MTRTEPSTTRLAGPLFAGAGLAGTADEVVLHQLLQWHHFYDGSGPSTGLVSDGVFHLFSSVLLVLGVVLIARDPVRSARPVAGGVLVGAGGFNLYDGVVQHKLLGLHQVRAGVTDLLPYDAAFFGLAVLLLGAGLILLRRVDA